MTSSSAGELNLGHIFDAAGVDISDMVVLRHTYTPDGLKTEADLTAEKILDYTRRQGIGNKLGKIPPGIWVVFMADGGRRSRLLTAYENHGEVLAERTDTRRCFDLRPSSTLDTLSRRLVIQWSGDPVNWAKPGPVASAFRVLEIADPQAVAFPGFDNVLLTHAELQAMVEDSRYSSWRTALGAVQGIYLLADTSTGQLYVGKADGGDNILGRWSAYARDGHGGNVALRDLIGPNPSHARHFQFSILRVFGPSVPTAEVDAAEAHFKRALLTREHGLNRN
ncbi:GIY-YIG nuclease family protein [Kocuria sabuli]|uniref:GIY-YIG nuclease family protein n=1 Tax=Kocuria sabuli TaxID=3071448 RepID=UPI0034D58325